MDLRRSINTKIWDDPWFAELSHDEKLLWLYLLTNSFTNMLGVYEISERKMVFDTGLTSERIRKAFEGFERVKKAKYSGGFVILYNWIKNQSYNKNMITSALNILENLPANIKMSIKDRFLMELGKKNESLSKGKVTLSKDSGTLSKIEDEKEIESEEEDEEKKTEITDKVFVQLSKSNIWLEKVAMFYQSDVDLTLQHFRKFYNHCMLNDSFKNNTTDAKKHFRYWIEKGNPIPKRKTNSNFDGF